MELRVSGEMSHKYNYMWNPGLHIMRKLKVPHDFIFEMEPSV